MTNAMFERMKPLPFTAPMAIAARLVLLVCGVSGLAGAALADERSDGVTPRIVLAPQAPLARGAEIARAVVYLEAEEADVSLTPGSSLASPILLRVQGPVFGWLGDSEPYPDRHFPELRFFSNGQPVPYTESFRATVGTVDISALLSDAKVSPWLIADTPPFVATEDMPAETRSKLRQAGAISASGGDYLAQWRAQRTLGVALVPGQTLDMRYRLRPGYALLSLQELGGATLRQRYCLTGSHLQALQKRFGRQAQFVARYYAMAVGWEGRVPSSARLTVVPQPGVVQVAACTRSAKQAFGMDAVWTDVEAVPDRQSVLHVLTLEPVIP